MADAGSAGPSILLIAGLLVAWAVPAAAASKCVKYEIVKDADNNLRSVCVKYAPGSGPGDLDCGATGRPRGRTMAEAVCY